MEAGRDDDPDVSQPVEKMVATRALGRVGPEAKAGLPALVRVLKTDTDPRMRVAAIRTLGAMGPAASSAVPFLIEMLNSEDPFPHYATLCARIDRTGSPGALPALVKRLDEQESRRLGGRRRVAPEN